MQSIYKSDAKYGGAAYFIITYIIFHMVIINLFVAISYEAYNKFVSKPKQARKSGSARPKKLGQRIKVRLGKFRNFFTQYTKGTRKSVSSSPRPARRASVTIKRRSLHGMREKISDSSLGEAILEVREDGVVELPKTPDLSSLPRGKRHEMILKQRMQQKGEAKGRQRRQRNTGDKVGSLAEVVRQYTAKSDEEISLAPGQKIKVLDKAGTKYKGLLVDGPNAGKNGWFPAFAVGSFVSELNKAQEKKPLPKTESQPKFVRKQNADWTKDIIGPMTIMNPEELKELNKILKANARGARSSTDSHRGSIDSASTPTTPKPALVSPGPRVSSRNSRVPIMNIVEEEEEEEEESENDNVFLEINKLYSKPMQLPEVIIEQPSIVLEEEEVEEPDQKHLHSPKVHTPEMKAKEKWKKKMTNKTKDMPEWAKKFMSQSNAKVADAASIKSPTESDEIDPLSRFSTTSVVLPIEQPDLVIENTTASNESAPELEKVSENKSTILNIPESPRTESKPPLAVTLTPSPNVTVVLPITEESSKPQDTVTLSEPQIPLKKAPEPSSKSRRNRPRRIGRSGSVPVSLPSGGEKRQPPVVRSETEVRIVVQPAECEQIVDFE